MKIFCTKTVRDCNRELFYLELATVSRLTQVLMMPNTSFSNFEINYPITKQFPQEPLINFTG